MSANNPDVTNPDAKKEDETTVTGTGAGPGRPIYTGLVYHYMPTTGSGGLSGGGGTIAGLGQGSGQPLFQIDIFPFAPEKEPED